MNTFQLILLIWLPATWFVSLGSFIYQVKAKYPKKEKYDLWGWLLYRTLNTGTLITFLYLGGFWA